MNTPAPHSPPHLAPPVIKWLSSLLDDKHLCQFELVQPLWSDFGQLLRCYSPARQSTLIIKLISVPKTFNHPHGFSTSTSQQRKLRSYRIEQHFYLEYGALCETATIADLVIADQRDGVQVLVLGDLNALGYTARHTSLSVSQCRVVLAWLAAFHAKFMNIAPNGLWPQGSYWHLATRQDEWHNMPDGELKQQAAQLDELLQRCPWRTLIHGDAKVANFCFSQSGDAVAAVDFQYVGGGIGVQDVCYFLGSALSERQQARSTEACLDYYFSHLKTHLAARFKPPQINQICAQWRALYCVASADFHRFLMGWNPAHFKINTVLAAQTKEALMHLQQRYQ
ncbi:phosphotransferase [Alteromonas gilva]|uniref:Phosphotransferase n=1 Tax=Alteromonas gilva TaxID=2987522 RepID=A0ABT5L4B8_9ALTE|nr:phosphotransferase [Alteromonas gilva]MDC8831279.1 phosphotransferase [Alteromonas gilva]